MHQWDHLVKRTMKQGCIALTSFIVKVKVSMQLSVKLKVWVKQTSFLRYPKGWKVPPSQAKSMSVSLKGWTASWMEAAPWGDTIVCSACTDVQCSSGGFLRCKSYCCHHRVPPLCLDGPTGTDSVLCSFDIIWQNAWKNECMRQTFPSVLRNNWDLSLQSMYVERCSNMTEERPDSIISLTRHLTG